MKYSTFKALGLLAATFSSTTSFASSTCDTGKFQKLLSKDGTYNSEAKLYFEAIAKKNTMMAKKNHLEFLAKKIQAAGCKLEFDLQWAYILKSVYVNQGFTTAIFDGSGSYRSYVTQVPQAYDPINASVVLGNSLKTFVDSCKGYSYQKEQCLIKALNPKDYEAIQKQRVVDYTEQLGDAVETAYRMYKNNKTNHEVSSALKGLNDNSKMYTAIFWALILQNNNNFFENETLNMLSIYGSDPTTHFEWIVE